MPDWNEWIAKATTRAQQAWVSTKKMSTDAIAFLEPIVNWAYPRENRREDRAQFIEGFVKASDTRLAFTVTNSPKTQNLLIKLAGIHLMYLAMRLTIQSGLRNSALFVLRQEEDSWAAEAIDVSLYLGCLMAISPRWVIATAGYNVALAKSAMDEMFSHLKSRNKELPPIRYQGTWEDKKAGGSASLFYYLADYYAAAAIGSIIPWSGYITFPLVEGRSLVEGNLVMYSYDGITTAERREILANQLPFCAGVGVVFYATYKIGCLLVKHLTGIDHPLVNATIYSFVYSLFVVQSYRIRQLPPTRARRDLFSESHHMMERWLQKTFDFIISYFQETKKPAEANVSNTELSSEKVKVFFNSEFMKTIKKYMIGFEEWPQYLKKDEIKQILRAYEVELKTFFEGAFKQQEKTLNKIAVLAEPYLPDSVLSSTARMAIKNVLNKEGIVQKATYNLLIDVLREVPVAEEKRRELMELGTQGARKRSLVRIDGYDASDRPVKLPPATIAPPPPPPPALPLLAPEVAIARPAPIAAPIPQAATTEKTSHQRMLETLFPDSPPPTHAPTLPPTQTAAPTPIRTSSPHAFSGDLPQKPNHSSLKLHVMEDFDPVTAPTAPAPNPKPVAAASVQASATSDSDWEKISDEDEGFEIIPAAKAPVAPPLRQRSILKR